MLKRLNQLILFLLLYLVVLILLYRFTDNEKESTKPYHSYSPIISRKQNGKLILLWTPFFGNYNYTHPLKTSGCTHTNCFFTSNKSQLEISDALIIHHRDFDPEKIPKRFNFQQIWIWFNHESPVHTPHNLHYLNGKINWTINYRLDADITDLPYLVNRTSHYELKKDYSLNKNKPLVWFVSHCKTPGKRENYIQHLNRSLGVDVYGRCGNLECQPPMSSECYKKILPQYYFYLSFENSICMDYVTEKFFNVLDYDIVPIVFGGANYSRHLPFHAYIDALSFDSPFNLSQYLVYLMNNPKEYNKFFEWKKYYTFKSTYFGCKICDRLHNNHGKRKIWQKLGPWWFRPKCKAWTPKRLKLSKYVYQ